MSRTLSVAQQGLWLINQIRPDDADFHVPAVFHLHGPVDPAALRTALERVIARHGELRSSYPMDDEGPYRRVLADVPVSWSDLPPQREPAVDGFLARPFDLTTEPPVRAAYQRTGPEDGIFALCVHHIACDAASLAVILDDLSSAYAGASPGPVEHRQAELADEQAQWLQGPQATRLADFWRTQLNGSAPLFSGSGGAVPATGRPAATCHAVLPRRAAQEVSRLARDSGATVAMALLAGYAATIAQCLATPDVTVGMPVSMRGPRDRDAVGCLVNLLPIRLRQAGGQGLDETLVVRARDACLAAFRHAALPGERISELAGDRRGRLSPLIEAVFNVARGRPRLTLPGARCKPVETAAASVQVPLDLQATEQDDGSISLVLRYDRELLSRETAVELFSVLLGRLQRPSMIELGPAR